MKKQLLPVLSLVLLLGSCNNNTTDTKKKITANNGLLINDAEGTTGTFSVNQSSYSGQVSTQYFGSKEKGNFSVLCQQDAEGSRFALLQITFINEQDALENSVFNIYNGSMLPITNPEPGSVTVALNGNGESFGDTPYAGTSASTGNISVKDRILVIKDLKLFNGEGQQQLISASIPF